MLFRVDVGVPVGQGITVPRRRSSHCNRHMPTLQTRTSRFLFPSSQASLSLRGPEWHPRVLRTRRKTISDWAAARAEGSKSAARAGEGGERGERRRCGEWRVATRELKDARAEDNVMRWRRGASSVFSKGKTMIRKHPFSQLGWQLQNYCLN